MATFRRKAGRVVIEYWCREEGKKKAIPRSKIKFLDSMPDDEGRAWADLWEQENGAKVEKALQSVLLQTDECSVEFNRFLASYQARKSTSETTCDNEKQRFNKHIVPIFVTELGKKDFRTWGTSIPDFTSRLLSKKKLQPAQVNKCLGLLKRFSKFLKTTGKIPHVWDVDYVYAPRSSSPLLISINPYDIYKFVNHTADIRIQLIALLAYSGSLRPEEIFALKKEDFLTGQLAVEKSPTFERFQRVGLGSKLTVHIRRIMNGKSKIVEHTKKENLMKRSAASRKMAEIESSGEYVTFWDLQGAKLLASLLKKLPDGFLFNVGRKRLFEVWQEASSALELSASIKDLRRASGFYLGRDIDIPPTVLQEHMRHESISTTELYMRRPNVENPENSKPNFDDVG